MKKRRPFGRPFPECWQLCLPLLLAAFPLSGQSLHAVLVGDLGRNGGIGGGVRQDLDRVYHELDFLCRVLDLPFSSSTFATEQQFDGAAVLQHLRELPVDKDRILVFYYSGHGQCSKDNPLPYLRIGKGLHMQEVLQAIRDKRPQLALVLTDCCNGDPPRQYADRSDIRHFPSTRQLDNLAFLFQDFRGEIVATAARYGQEAYIGPQGSYFTQSFFDVLRQLTTAEVFPNWTMVLTRTQERTRRQVELDKFDLQLPYFNINISRLRRD